MNDPLRTTSYHPHRNLISTRYSEGSEKLASIKPVIRAGSGKSDATIRSHVKRAVTENIPNYGTESVTVSRHDFERLCSKLNSVENALFELKNDIRRVADGPRIKTEGQILSPASTNTTPRHVEEVITRHLSTQGIHTRNEMSGETIHLGGSSVPALIMALGQGAGGRPGVQELMGRSILPIFGLDNESATYPFVDLWGLPHGSMSRTEELCKAIPSDAECLEFFRCYRDMAHIIFPGLHFECLRFTNFLSLATLESIQTLLVMGNVISNTMNAGVAWSLLGLTIRWAVIWQDSLLSITYDRASSTATIEHHLPWSTPPGSGCRPYYECMYRLSKVGLDIVRDRATVQESHHSLLGITEHRNELTAMMRDAADYLRDSRKCRSLRDQLEHWALYLHSSYIMSELCRPAISPSTAEHDLARTLKQVCVDNLVNTVEAFLGLHNITPYASRSWASVHRSLSSALLLAIMGEPARNDRARNLLGKLVSAMSDLTSTVDPSELSAPMARGIAALRKLNIQESRTPHDLDSLRAAPLTVNDSHDYNRALNLDEASFFTPSPNVGLDEESSPYSLMDSILWGRDKRAS
ncbi:hypothetical protein LTR04_007158 [Oleoguttula sp. CCFEE 6159]|nr:hypothetical protein LTR04_007158 [Oleoguttula sp. CCFEE 6159]